MGSKIIFMRRTEKEIEIFGGDVHIDIDGKNVATLGKSDYTIHLDNGIHKIKMYKSHTYDTFIGFAEAEIDVLDNKNLLISYSSPMLITQPGNIVVSDYQSEQQVNAIVSERKQKIFADHRKEENLKQKLEAQNQNGMLIFVIIMIIATILIGISTALEIATISDLLDF